MRQNVLKLCNTLLLCTTPRDRPRLPSAHVAIACSVANTAFERILGTIVGGLTGFVVRCIGEYIYTPYEWIMYGLAAGGIGAAGIWLGEMLDLGTSGKLLTITFLLVFAGGTNPVRLMLRWRHAVALDSTGDDARATPARLRT